MALFSGLEEIIHPMTVHFPIALILVSCLLAVIYIIDKHDASLNLCLRVLVVLGAISAWAAVITGSYHLKLTPEAELIKHIHHNFATWTAWIISISALFYLIIIFYRKPLPKIIGILGFIFLIAATVLISFTGFYGGYIVYNVLL